MRGEGRRGRGAGRVRSWRLGLVVRDAEQLVQLARLVHVADDVGAANKLALHEQLRESGPVAAQ